MSVLHSPIMIPMPTQPVTIPTPLPKVSLLMTRPEATALLSLKAALREANIELRPGHPIVSHADALRWLLAAIHGVVPKVQ